ncbi:MAG TPA: hypothetical protein VN368_02720 [Candidatus Methylomirabilis sp.]|nr:hypothetical protein [Candidatus Methylomirabilis sp.]
MTNTISKTKSHAFKKDCYLLGRDKHGDLIWLESATFDCGWYWGFGCIEVYTNQKNPALAKDINNHSHWDGLLGKQPDGKYLHHINECLQESVLTDTESWQLSDLMKSFYTLKEAAEVFGRGGSHLTTVKDFDALKSHDMVKTINEVMLPALFKKVYSILEPEFVAA